MNQDKVKVIIDGRHIDAVGDQTILQAALDAGIYIPYLCYYPGMKPFGACRTCVVEVDGRVGTPASCTTPVSDGMVVRTDTSIVQEVRQGIMELLISEHPHGCLTCHRVDLCGKGDICLRHVSVNDRCLTCPKDGRCELKDTIRYIGVSLNTPFTYNNRQLPIETGDPYYDRDYNLCIVCGRCVRACEEIRGDNAIAFVERAGRVLVGTSQGTSLLESGCEFCGSCIDVCPVGALVERDDKWAKADKRVPTTCPFCPVGCQLNLEVDRRGKVIRSIGAPEAEVNRGQLCFKGKFGMGFVNHPSRLRTPLVRHDGELEEASWEEALQVIADRLRKNSDGGFGLLISPRSTNEELYLAQKFARCVMGTNNIDYSTNNRPELVVGLGDTLGYMAGTNSLWDLERSDCVLIVSANLTEEHNIVGIPIKRNVKAGATLLVIDPREVEMTRHATLWLRPRAGTELLVLMGMLSVLIKEGEIDTEFVAEHCQGLSLLKGSLTDFYQLSHVEELTGVRSDQIREAALLYARSQSSAIVYALDTLPAEHRLDATHAIVNLALLAGQIGKSGGGLYPLLQGANAQGAWDLGCVPHWLPGQADLNDEVERQGLSEIWQTQIPREVGLGVVGMSDACREGKLKSLLVIGDELESSHGFTFDREGLDKLDFLAVHATFLGEFAQRADVVLPAATFVENIGTYTNLERRIQVIRPVRQISNSQARPAWIFLCQLAQALDSKEFNFSEPEQVFTEIQRTNPSYQDNGLTGFVRAQEIGVPNLPGHPLPQQFYPTLGSPVFRGLQWPLAHGGTEILYRDGFPIGRARLVPLNLLPEPSVLSSDFPLVLAWGRVLHQPKQPLWIETNGGNHIRRDQIIEVNPRDAAKYGLDPNTQVEIVTPAGLRFRVTVEITERIPSRLVGLTTLFGELAVQLQGSNVPDPMRDVPGLSLCPVRLERVTLPGQVVS